jgi:hypothetical protein
MASADARARDRVAGLISARDLLIYLVACLVASMAAIASGIHFWTDNGTVGVISAVSAGAAAWSLTFLHLVTLLDRIVTRP